MARVKENMMPELESGKWGDCSVSTQLLTVKDGAVVSLTKIVREGGRKKSPVIFLPGMFSNRHFWMSAKGIGLAAQLASVGHDCWLVERRGTGISPRHSSARCGLDETVQIDLPMIQQRVASDSSLPAYWIGHSFGGVAISLAVATTLNQDRVAGLVLFASQFEVGKQSLRWPGRIFTQCISRMYGYFPARRLGLGPENEPVAAIDDACKWTTRACRDQSMQQMLAGIHCPVMALVGAADKVDPAAGCEKFISHMSSNDKTYCLAGKAHGFKEDYNHPGIVVSKSAAFEIWPKVGEWMYER